MHPVLLIDEVLEMILESCAEWDRTEYLSTLCKVARSCKAWKEPALDRLWQRLDSVEPLLPLFESYTAAEVSITTSCLSTICVLRFGI